MWVCGVSTTSQECPSLSHRRPTPSQKRPTPSILEALSAVTAAHQHPGILNQWVVGILIEDVTQLCVCCLQCAYVFCLIF